MAVNVTREPLLLPEDIRDVLLNRHELRYGGSVALEHHIENIEADRHDTAWGNGLDLTSRVRAYWAEQAFAKSVGVPWIPRTWEERDRGDVAGCEVKNSPNPKYPNLAVRPRDLENMKLRERPYVLVVGRGPRFAVVGWRYAYEAPDYGEWKAPDPSKPPAWFITWQRLRCLTGIPLDRTEAT